MKKWLFNPFVYIAGAKSLVIGWAIMLVTAVICYYSKTHFDGIIDTHNGHTAPMQVYFWEQLTDWGCAVVLFYSAGLVFSRSAIRFIDVAGTMALTRWVMIFPAIIGFGLNIPNPIHSVADITALTVALAIVVLLFTVWMIALMYNACSVSLNIKGGKATGIFIAVLLLAELLSHVILHQLYKHFI